MSDTTRKVTLGAMMRRLTGLSPLAVRQYLGRLGLSTGLPDMPVPAAQRFVLYAVDFLNAMPVHTDVLRAVVDQYWAQLVAGGEEVAACAGGRVPQFRVAVLDRRYVSVSGTAGFMDTTDASVVPKLPGPPIETITYDLTALFFSADQPR